MRIKINKTQIAKIGYELNEQAEEIERQQKNINNIINDLSNAWRGTDYNTCRSIVEEKLLPGLNKASTAIDDLGNYLRKVPATYDSLDNKYKKIKMTK